MQITGTLAAKLAAALLAASGIGVAGWKISSNKSEPEVVSLYLTRIGRSLASTDAEWESLKDFYSKESAIHPISGISKDQIKKESIRDWCNSELSKIAKEQTESHLLLIESWCSKPQKLSERLSSVGKSKLDNTGETDSTTWTKYESEYKKSENQLKIKKKDSSSSTWSDFNNSEATVQILKEWCKEHEDDHFKHQKDVLFEKYEKWCSK
ncbi:hypothetical protein MHF_0535 [Mycoplasma haemofelis Ohio2]|uniref:Uncharacterized protein n=1 Tax=Mycoplasma haemofelis (strain Ohio2) TaxID=859194 RepID=F6FHV9_MYCHI|nr:hypothetical protein MHF_0535 [Mycoplasma haemofelis Ohio2]